MPDVAAERPGADAEQRTDGGALMARTLRERGVTTVFSLPGGHILPFLDASLDEDVRIIDTRHEGAAVLAAEGWALATGGTGVAAVTAGPGFANGLIGLLDAGVWSVPLVMVAGRTSRNRQGRGAVGDVDQKAIAAPVAKWAATCTEAGRSPDTLRRRCTERAVAVPVPSISRSTRTPCTAKPHRSTSPRPASR